MSLMAFHLTSEPVFPLLSLTAQLRQRKDVGLSVCQKNYAKAMVPNSMKTGKAVEQRQRGNPLNFGEDLHIFL